MPTFLRLPARPRAARVPEPQSGLIGCTRDLINGLPARTVGRLLVVAAFVAGGLGSVLAKFTLDLGTTPLSFLFVRLIAAVAVLWLLTGRDMWRVPLHRQTQLLGTGLLFGAQSLAYFSAVAVSPVALVVVTVSSYPVAVLVMDAIDTRTVPRPARLIALAVSLIGLWLAAGSPGATLDLGTVLALASAVGYAVYLRASATTVQARDAAVSRSVVDGQPHGGRVLAGRVQRRADSCDLALPPMVATLWVMLGALALVTAAMLLTTTPLPTPRATVLAAAHGLVATTFPLVAIYAALTRIRADDLAGMGPLEPIVASGLAVVVLDERLTGAQLIGIAIVVAAVAHMAGVLRAGRPGALARPRVGLPRLPLVLDRVARPERRRPHVVAADRVAVARLWSQPQS